MCSKRRLRLQFRKFDSDGTTLMEVCRDGSIAFELKKTEVEADGITTLISQAAIDKKKEYLKQRRATLRKNKDTEYVPPS